MSYINNDQNFGNISFNNIGFNTSVEVAKEMKNDIISFFTEHPDGLIDLDFAANARLSPEFARELFGDKTLKRYITQIRTKQMHDSDRETMMKALND